MKKVTKIGPFLVFLLRCGDGGQKMSPFLSPFSNLHHQQSAARQKNVTFFVTFFLEGRVYREKRTARRSEITHTTRENTLANERRFSLSDG